MWKLACGCGQWWGATIKNLKCGRKVRCPKYKKKYSERGPKAEDAYLKLSISQNMEKVERVVVVSGELHKNLVFRCCGCGCLAK
jgi:hypothetical protein